MQLLAKQLVLAHTPSCPWRIVSLAGARSHQISREIDRFEYVTLVCSGNVLVSNLVIAPISTADQRRSYPYLATIHQDLLLLNPPISSHLAPLAFDVESNILARGETPSVAHFEEADIELVSPLVCLSLFLAYQLPKFGKAHFLLPLTGRYADTYLDR